MAIEVMIEEIIILLNSEYITWSETKILHLWLFDNLTRTVEVNFMFIDPTSKETLTNRTVIKVEDFQHNWRVIHRRAVFKFKKELDEWLIAGNYEEIEI